MWLSGGTVPWKAKPESCASLEMTLCATGAGSGLVAKEVEYVMVGCDVGWRPVGRVGEWVVIVETGEVCVFVGGNREGTEEQAVSRRLINRLAYRGEWCCLVVKILLLV